MKRIAVLLAVMMAVQPAAAVFAEDISVSEAELSEAESEYTFIEEAQAPEDSDASEVSVLSDVSGTSVITDASEITEDAEESAETVSGDLFGDGETEVFADSGEAAIVGADSAQEESIPTEQISLADVNLPDSEELLQGYLDQQLTADTENSLSAEYGRVSSQELSGQAKIVYDILKEKIAEVAEGTVTSTSFFISYADLGLKESYTAAELTEAAGITVDAIISDNQVTSAAQEAIGQLVGGDTGLIMFTLLADYPYEMYWFDKTAGISYAPDGYMYNSSTIQLNLSEGVTYSFPVAADYAADTYTTNGKPARVTEAVTNAKEIVAEYAGKSDYEKLKAYKTEICNRVSYNTAAAADSSTAFGDPWQLIYVLDNDTTNQVVCEGYAKAFKYLCDLTAFSGNVACYTVSGSMGDESGLGNHMWNIVRVSNESFLVDVTNCDEGMIGCSDQLFLRGIVAANGDSGSVSDGYWLTANGSRIAYVYESTQSTIYGTDILTLADHNMTETTGTATEATTEATTDTATESTTAAATETESTTNTAAETTPTPTPTPAGTEASSGENDSGDAAEADETETGRVVPEGGTTLTDTATGAVYQVTQDFADADPVAVYQKPQNAKASSVVIPDTITVNGRTCKVTSIANNAFKNNRALKKVKIGKYVQTIGKNAFYGCTKLTSVTGGAALTKIGDSAFQKCTALKKITIPSKVKSIGKKAFYGCKNLRTVTIKTKLLTAKTVGSKAFTGTYKKATVKVPSSKLKLYKKVLKAKGLNKSAKVKK